MEYIDMITTVVASMLAWVDAWAAPLIKWSLVSIGVIILLLIVSRNVSVRRRERDE